MSYTNQLEVLLLDRHKVHDMLLALAGSQTLPKTNGRSHEEQLAWLRRLSDERSDLERRFLDALAEEHHRLPDDGQRGIQEPRCVVDFYYRPNVCVFCDGCVYDAAEQAAKDARLRREFVERGYRVVVVRHDSDLSDHIRRYPEVFGKGCGREYELEQYGVDPVSWTP